MEDELEYIKRLETSKLIEIIQDIFGFEETSAALLELYNRDINKTLELGIDILENNKGDDYLQATVFDIIYDINPMKTLGCIYKRKADIGVVLLGDIMSEVSIDIYKKTNIQIPDELLNLLLERYHNLDEFEQNKIIDYFTEFEENINARGRT
ncbi:hypothetical protein DS742_08530 [Lacrimispora amygdalina]|uniref:Uncharacterized protein n=1 Tax=Lacrimispora amygdalina TaxID=253257 RepID=A0A3E2NE55_9FIRM|nr:hypothetical protein [Clostridium indicum]RFZ79264.1 hypothetical protein DS742_08530 [Clostridium indicum]